MERVVTREKSLCIGRSIPNRHPNFNKRGVFPYSEQPGGTPPYPHPLIYAARGLRCVDTNLQPYSAIFKNLNQNYRSPRNFQKTRQKIPPPPYKSKTNTPRYSKKYHQKHVKPLTHTQKKSPAPFGPGQRSLCNCREEKAWSTCTHAGYEYTLGPIRTQAPHRNA